MRIVIIGNSGSGKSTLARWLATRGDGVLLDLDTVAWEPGQIAVPRENEAAEREVRSFCAAHERWIIEGCYADLAQVASSFGPRLVFLDLGPEHCLAHCRARPWEPHKYPSKEEQDRRLPMLLDWVRDYDRREGPLSHAAHLELFEAHPGPKDRLTSPPSLDPPDDRLLAWIA